MKLIRFGEPGRESTGVVVEDALEEGECGELFPAIER
jgi:hypothetical protein